jgi:hypothetical protein
LTPASEPGHRAGQHERQREQPDPLVEADHGGGDRADERDVAEGVAGEDLGAQDHEPSREPAGERDEGAGEVGVADEVVGEHQAAAPCDA